MVGSTGGSAAKNSLDTQLCTQYNIHQTNIADSHKQKNRKQNMADTKIEPQHHSAGRSLRFPLSVCLFVPLCLSALYPRSTLVETPLQISLFFAKQTQFQNGQYKHKYSKNKGLCQRTTNNEQRTLPKTNPIKPNSAAPPRRNTRYENSPPAIRNTQYAIRNTNPIKANFKRSSVVRKIAPYRCCRTRDCHPFDCAQGRIPRNDGGVKQDGLRLGICGLQLG
jgi:hypothetical protein